MNLVLFLIALALAVVAVSVKGPVGVVLGVIALVLGLISVGVIIHTPNHNVGVLLR